MKGVRGREVNITKNKQAVAESILFFVDTVITVDYCQAKLILFSSLPPLSLMENNHNTRHTSRSCISQPTEKEIMGIKYSVTFLRLGC